MPRADRLIPEHHVGQHSHGQKTDDGLEQLLLLLREIRSQPLQARTDGQGQRHGQADTHAHHGHPASPSGPAEVGGDDADDEGGFQPLAEHDEKRCEHRAHESESCCCCHGCRAPSPAEAESARQPFAFTPEF